MDKIKQIIALAEHPELFSEEQMEELLSDDDSLQMYVTVSETIMALETARSGRKQKAPPIMR